MVKTLKKYKEYAIKNYAYEGLKNFKVVKLFGNNHLWFCEVYAIDYAKDINYTYGVSFKDKIDALKSSKDISTQGLI